MDWSDVGRARGTVLRGGLGLAAALLVAACSKKSVEPEPQAEATAPTQASAPVPAATEPGPVTAPAPAEGPASPSASAGAPRAFASDTLPAEKGPLRITPIHHGTLRIEFKDRVIYVDPVNAERLAGQPKADLVLVTDIHGDHYDAQGIAAVKKASTKVVAPQVVADKEKGVVVMKNGERKKVAGVPLEAVAMYNLKRGPASGGLYHDKGRGNGYVLELGGKRVYVSGDTECTDEMRALAKIDVAFVCMNLPFTMPPEEAAECVRAFRPKLVYPYHYRGSELAKFKSAVASLEDVEVRLREWYAER